MKRLIPLLVVAIVVVATAPAAMANHCQRCGLFQLEVVCKPVSNFGFPICDDGNGCMTSGPACGNHVASAELALASEYSVASVERIDEVPAATASFGATLVASLETPQASTR